jgi:lipoprotein-releasing system ATP-binding protein
MKMPPPLLAATSIHKSYPWGTGRLAVLRDLELEVGAGELVAISGASGSGKSTLLHLLGALDLPDAGAIAFHGRPLSGLADRELAAYRNRHVGFVFQFFHLLPEFSALENTFLPAMIGGASQAAASERARALLERVGLGERLEARPTLLSGGERQRVALARALVTSPDLLLADEPTGNLDAHTGSEIFSLLRELVRERGLSAVLATHNPELAAGCDRRLHLADGHLTLVP